MGESTNAKVQLVVRWRIFILKLWYGVATCKSKCKDLQSHFWFRSVWSFTAPTCWCHLRYLYSQLFLAFKAQKYFKRRIRLPRVLCFIFVTVCSLWNLHRIIPWSPVSLEIMGSLILRRKMSSSQCLWAVAFVPAGEGAELLTSSPLKLSLDLLQAAFLVMCRLLSCL